MASNSSEAQVLGLEEVLANLRRMPDVIRDQMARHGLKAAAEVVRNRAALLAPKETGSLAFSLESSVKKNSTSLFAKVKAKAPHAHLMEFGFWWTRKMGRRKIRFFFVENRKFLRPALYDQSDKVREIFRDDIVEALKQLEVTNGAN